MKHSDFQFTDLPELTGKVILITGGKPSEPQLDIDQQKSNYILLFPQVHPD